jgi:hypothetical protein
MIILLRAIFRQLISKRNFADYLGQDPDPDVFESWIRSKIAQIRNIGLSHTLSWLRFHKNDAAPEK